MRGGVRHEARIRGPGGGESAPQREETTTTMKKERESAFSSKTGALGLKKRERRGSEGEK